MAVFKPGKHKIKMELTFSEKHRFFFSCEGKFDFGLSVFHDFDKADPRLNFGGLIVMTNQKTLTSVVPPNCTSIRSVLRFNLKGKLKRFLKRKKKTS